MGTPIDFEGTNLNLLGGRENVCDMRVFNNGTCTVSCWELTQKEKQEIVVSGQVFASVFFGPTSPPLFVGSEETVRGLIADYGVWKRRKPIEPVPDLHVCETCGQPNLKGTNGIVLFFDNPQQVEEFMRIWRSIRPNGKVAKL